MTGYRRWVSASQTKKNRFLIKEIGFFVHGVNAANRPYYSPSTLPMV